MSAPMTATIQLDEFHHLRLWQLIFFRSIPRALGWYAIVIAALLAFFQSQDGWSYDLLWGLGGGFVWVLSMLAALWLSLPFRARKIFNETSQITLPKQFTADEAGFEFVCETGHQRTTWSELVKWDENSDVIALFLNRIMAYVIPKAQISPELQVYIRDQLHNAGLPKPGKVAK